MGKVDDIERYKDGKGRQKSHTYLNKKYQKALKDGFYFETLMISYNLVEDRLVALLHYAGVVSRDADQLKVTSRTKKAIRALLGMNEKEHFKIDYIERKIEIFRAFLISEESDIYILAVKEKLMETNDRDYVLDVLSRCKDWKNERNIYVHGLANKNPADIEALAKSIAEEGYRLARELDNIVGRFSKSNTIRRAFKIQ